MYTLYIIVYATKKQGRQISRGNNSVPKVKIVSKVIHIFERIEKALHDYVP